MASSKCTYLNPLHVNTTTHEYTAGLAKVQKPEDDAETNTGTEPPLPQTLVRIPTQHAPAVLPQPTSDD